jgi:shikimate kinase
LSLLGLPGAGKTTLGRQLATHYGRQFLDLDAAIVTAAGCSIPAIFAAEGEAGFRVREAAVLRQVLAAPGPPLVLATGGGTPCFHGNLAVLNAAGCTLWLDVPVPVLAARLAAAAETTSRPLLAPTGATEQWLRETLAARKQFYRQAHVRCQGAACTVAAVVAQLAAAGFAPAPMASLPPVA